MIPELEMPTRQLQDGAGSLLIIEVGHVSIVTIMCTHMCGGPPGLVLYASSWLLVLHLASSKSLNYLCNMQYKRLQHHAWHDMLHDMLKLSC